jgi:hypothetical protein
LITAPDKDEREMRRVATAAGTLTLLVASLARADVPPADASSDSSEVKARSETYFQPYRRALLPGAYGATVETQTAVPIVEYASLTANRIPAWSGSLRVEADVWGDITFGEAGSDRRVDGDVRTLSAEWSKRDGFVRVGRQHVAGGAARFSRFDGVMAGGILPFGLGGDVYAGFTVLPRWSARPGYQQLGAAADTLLKNSDAIPDPDRAGHWLAGGRLYFQRSGFDAGVSFHEQHEQSALAHRNLGADAAMEISDKATVGAYGIMDIDSTRFADARAFASLSPFWFADLDVELLHTEPALFLSRQSVLSVFSTDQYEEAGGTVTIKPMREVAVIGSSFTEFYSSGDIGSRNELGVKVSPDRWGRTLVRVSGGRVYAVGNGYRMLRSSLRQRIVHPLTATAEAYFYFYDEDIRGRSSSSVYAGTLEWAFQKDLRLLWGASLASTPYANTDAQTLLRLAYGFGEVLR